MSSKYEVKQYLNGFFFWDIMSCQPRFRWKKWPPCSGSKYKWRKKPAWNRWQVSLLADWFTLISCLPYSSTLKIEAKCSSETSVDFKQATQPYIPEHRTPHNHCWEDIKCHLYGNCKRLTQLHTLIPHIEFFLQYSSFALNPFSHFTFQHPANLGRGWGDMDLSSLYTWRTLSPWAGRAQSV
jgi:hypothetical protein